ncbi:MAG: hypothetical protein LBU65_17160 [Planctomycetaceae bacterium]|jgi:hypothetical protein|nr:hypothetical protein [Planctomycetaceae bacterium]
MLTIRTTVNSDILSAFIDIPVEWQNRNVVVTVEESPENPCEEREQFRRNRERIMAEYDKKPKRWSHEELIAQLRNGPVATEEEIKMQNEFRKDFGQWRLG